MSRTDLTFNPPPGWPKPPEGWQPPAGWTPDPSWPEPPPGWQLWIPSLHNTNQAPPIQEGTDGSDAVKDTSSRDAGQDSNQLALLRAENLALREALNQTGINAEEVIELDDERVLQEVGIYRYHHPLETAVAYKERLSQVSDGLKALVKTGGAIEVSTTFAFDNSAAKGRKMSTDLGKLMLRAYNAEAENCLRSLRAGNLLTAQRRLERTRETIAKLGALMEMHISEPYHKLRLEELELTSDWLVKKQEEKEAAREERARLREEKRVEQELAAERERLDKERAHLTNAIAALQESGTRDPDLESRLSAIDAAIEENDFRAANIRAGYVYVISNRGAFGDGVVKIGLTRRLEPLERVSELSGASVPFPFDVHALMFSEDAVTLELELHKHFADRALNRANPRKEFFFATPAEVEQAMAERVGALLEFTEHAEATQFLQSRGLWPSDSRIGPA